MTFLTCQVVLEDLSSVFERLSPDCPFTAAPDLFPPDRFNAGVMGVWLGDQPLDRAFGVGLGQATTCEAADRSPSTPAPVSATVRGCDVLADMKRRLGELGTYDGGDTGLLNAYFSDWFARPPAARLPFRYNAQRTLHWLTHAKQPGYWTAVGLPPAVLHFSSSPKPWQAPKNKGELELVWWKYFMQAQMSGSGLASLLGREIGGSPGGSLGVDVAAAMGALGGC
jgi:glycogenin glucosyltransferase